MKSNSLKHIAQNFSNIMEHHERAIAPKELATKAHISYSTLAPILRGDRDFGVTKLIALAEALNVTPNDLLQGAYRETTQQAFMLTKPAPLHLFSFVTSAELTRCNLYTITSQENKNKLFSFSIACTANSVAVIEAMNSAIFDMCGQDIDLSKMYVYASVIGHEYLEGRNKLNELGSREYGLFVMEPDWKIAHSSIFPHQNGIVITINDGYVISYSTDEGKTVHKVQGYIPFASEAGNMWLGTEAIKHAINVKEGIEQRTLLSDKVLGIMHSDLNLLATRIFNNPRDIYIQMSTIVKELALHEKKSYSLIKQGFENIWKRIKFIDHQTNASTPICVTGDLAYLYESHIPKNRLFKMNYANDTECLNYSNNLLLSLLK